LDGPSEVGPISINEINGLANLAHLVNLFPPRARVREGLPSAAWINRDLPQPPKKVGQVGQVGHRGKRASEINSLHQSTSDLRNLRGWRGWAEIEGRR
jgi:hypothetical protein